MRFFGVNASPTTVDPIGMHELYDMGTLAVYSAINTLGEIWECYGKQIAEAVMTVVVVIAVALYYCCSTWTRRRTCGRCCHGIGHDVQQCCGSETRKGRMCCS
jgi:hypothetical protein